MKHNLDTQARYPYWRQSLCRSLDMQHNQPESKYFQIANIDSNLEVHNRTLVFRGFENKSNTILAITDTRSDKIAQWCFFNKSQICWYFTQSREQYRISVQVRPIVSENQAENFLALTHKELNKGSLLLRQKIKDSDLSLLDLQNESLRKTAWQGLSNTAKQQFYSVAPKLILRDTKERSRKPLESEHREQTEHVNKKTDDALPDNFAVLKFVPYFVDYLNLNTSPHERILNTYKVDKEKWEMVRVSA